MRMREFINIIEGFGDAPAVRPSFGRKGLPDEPIGRQLVSPPLQWREEVNQAREYPTAEEYADAFNPYHPMNTDPDSVHANYRETRRKLLQKWNLFHENNWL